MMNSYYDDNPLNFGTNPDPFWNARPLYGKPDLKKLYEQKEIERAERVAEEYECQKMMKQCLDKIRRILDEQPRDVDKIEQATREAVLSLKRKLDNRNFKRIGRFDIERIWNNEKELFQRTRPI